MNYKIPVVHTTLKIASSHPHDDTLVPLEQTGKRTIFRGLRKWLNNSLRGVYGDNVEDLTVRLQMASNYEPLRDAIVAMMSGAAGAGVTIGQEDIMRDVFGVKQVDMLTDWDIPHNAAIEWATREGDEILSGLIRTTVDGVGRMIADWVRNGESFGTLRRRLQQSHLFSESRANTVAVTEVTRAFAQGNIESWRQSGVIDLKTWNTAEDEIVRRCPICWPLNGVTVAMDAEFPGGYDTPPGHPNCRCWITGTTADRDEFPEGFAPPPITPVPPPVTSRGSTFIPATSKNEVVERMAAITDNYLMGDLSLDRQNSILKAMEGVLGSRGLRTDRIEPLRRRRGTKGAYGMATWNHRTGATKLEIQKSFANQWQKKQSEQIQLWNAQKERSITTYERYISNPRMEHLREKNVRRLQKIRESVRWSTINDADDALEAVATHEAYHIVDYNSNRRLRSRLVTSLEQRGITRADWDKVSDYGATEPAEIYAELGTAIDLGLPVPDDFIDAWNEANDI